MNILYKMLISIWIVYKQKARDEPAETSEIEILLTLKWQISKTPALSRSWYETPYEHAIMCQNRATTRITPVPAWFWHITSCLQGTILNVSHDEESFTAIIFLLIHAAVKVQTNGGTLEFGQISRRTVCLVIEIAYLLIITIVV